MMTDSTTTPELPAPAPVRCSDLLGCVERPAIRYYGGKWKLAPWIISHFPRHENYVEPCGGAASVLLQKQPSRLETYNDLDGNVVNFFRVLRSKTDALCDAIEMTPWSRAEYEAALKPADVDDVEAARRLWCCLNMSINAGNGMVAPGMRFVVREPEKLPELKSRPAMLDNLRKVAARLGNVQLENRPALEVIERYAVEGTLCYFDPPYVSETRAQEKRYAFEWTDDDHRKAADLLEAGGAMAVVSGYDCPLYAEIYEARGWRRHDKQAGNNSGDSRTESVWLNSRTTEALGGWLL